MIIWRFAFRLNRLLVELVGLVIEKTKVAYLKLLKIHFKSLAELQENEVDLILSSTGIFETPKDIADFTICPTGMFSTQLNDAHLLYSLPSTEEMK